MNIIIYAGEGEITATVDPEKILIEARDKGPGIDDIEQFKTTGILKGDDHMRVAFSDFVANPKENPLNTPSGKVEIKSEAFAETGFSSIPECRITEPESGYPFRMVTPHASFRINSQNSNLPWTEPYKARTLQMNHLDGKEK